MPASIKIRVIAELDETEVLTLKRRRAGLTQEVVAGLIGCSRLWVNRMESGAAPVGRLREFWRAREQVA